MEKLAHFIQESILAHQWRPIKLGKFGPPISHLFFADDLLLFAEADSNQVEVIKGCIDKFCNVSGQKINAAKTRVFFSSNVHHSRAQFLSEALGYQRTANLGEYLGIPLHHERVNKGNYQHLVDNVKKRLNSWQISRNSLAGRDTLIKSVVAAIPVYSMQTVNLPGSIHDSIERKARDFLWGSSDDHRRMHLVSWEKVCREKKNGGLGMKHLKVHNRAFMMKLGWGLIKDKDSLWAKVVREKYGCGRDLMPLINARKPGSNAWNGIRKNWAKVQEGTQLIRTMNDIEVPRWRWEKSGEFSVRSAYRSLSQEQEVHSGVWNKLWKLRVPQRCKTFSWLMLQERLITNKIKLELNLHTNGSCPRCQDGIEDVIHAIRDCSTIKKVWENVIPSSKQYSFFTGSIHEWFQWNMNFKQGPDREMWKNTFIVMCWLIWRDRNERIHASPHMELECLYPKAKAILACMQDTDRKLKKTNLTEASCSGYNGVSGNLTQVASIEVDGAFSHATKKTACGGLILDPQGSILEGFRCRLQSGNPLTAEIWGVLLGLKRAWDTGLRTILVKTDSQEAIQLIHSEISELHEDYTLATQVKQMLARQWTVTFTYVERDHNNRADFLAKLALNDSLGLMIMSPHTVRQCWEEEGLCDPG